LRRRAAPPPPGGGGAAPRRLADLPNVTLQLGVLPADLPRGPFDLIVVSEILYYLPAADLRRLVSRMATRLAPGGRIVLVHHLTDFADAAVKPRAAQAFAVAAFGRSMRLAYLRNAGRFQAAAFVKGAGPRRG
jgi:SAM-dependent methyltransferase